MFPGFKLIISFRGHFECRLERAYLRGLTGILINRSVQHTLLATDATAVVYYIDCYSDLSISLQPCLGDKSWVDISHLVNSLSTFSATDGFFDMGMQELDRLFPALTLLPVNNEKTLPLFSSRHIEANTVLDDRVQQMLDYIDYNIHKPLAVSQLADHINLSPDRARHLFKEQLGVPFSQYVLWKRVKSVIHAVVNDKLKLNQAAFEFGFADQSHFNHVFRRMFGLMPSSVLKNTSAIQFVSFLEAW